MPLLEVRGLVKRFAVRQGLLRLTIGWVRAVDAVTLSVERAQTLGIVGESGCGKSTLGRLAMGLLNPETGEVLVDGQPLAAWLHKDKPALRQRLQMVFQDPLDSLDPRLPVRESIAEPLQHKRLSRRDINARVRQALQEVQLPPEVAIAYPHELSGGQRQRVGIARAMIVEPAFVLCDEAVSSLDVSVRMQVLHLLARLQKEKGVAYWFISHDLAVVRAVSHEVAVMYLGAVVERGPAEAVLSQPWHPYTEALVAAVPRPDPEKLVRVQPLAGEVPSPQAVPSGCRFRTRCPLAQERCAREEPALLEKSPGRWVACHFRP